MRRHVKNALIAAAITAVSGIVLFLAMAYSIEWLMIVAYPLNLPGLLPTYILGLGSGGDVGAVLPTDVAQYVLGFFVWWGVITLADNRAGAIKRKPEDAHPQV